jgi:hypothetical protein
VSRPLLPVDGDLQRISTFLVTAPECLSIPGGCGDAAAVTEKQRKTAGDMIVRIDYILEEISRQVHRHPDIVKLSPPVFRFLYTLRTVEMEINP